MKMWTRVQLMVAAAAVAVVAAACIPPETPPNNTTTTTTSTSTTSTTSTTTTVPDSGEPGEPVELDAPPIDATVEPTTFGMTEFLFSGPDPVQVGVEPGTIVEQLAAATGGTVFDRDGDPLEGVRVEVVDRPELGHTITRADGAWDLVVNADEHVAVSFELVGHLPVHRWVRVAPGDWFAIEEVVLTPLDEVSTVIEVGADEAQVHQGSESVDDDGERTETVVFPSGLGAEMVLPDGTREPLTSMTVRATEYTVGEDGPEAMPGELPPSSAYTYAVELSVDEAIAAGATSVEFDAPVISYVDNFLDFPVGMRVPVATFSADEGRWIPDPDGLVVRVLDVVDGVAVLDLNGDGVADDPAEVGATPEELEALATTHGPGDTLWRVAHTHFSPKDYNLLGDCGACPAPDGSPPSDSKNPKKDKCDRSGSVIGCQDQTLGERLPVAGTPFTLVYESDRVPGRTADRTITIPITPEEATEVDVDEVRVRINVAGRVEEFFFGPEPGQTMEWTWDGLDAFGRYLPTSVTAQVEVANLYQSFFVEPDPRFPLLTFGSPSASDQVGPGRVFVANGTTTEVLLDNRNAAASAGLGGWTLDAHHRFEVDARRVMYGTGANRTLDGPADGLWSRVLAESEPFAGSGEDGLLSDVGVGFVEHMTSSPGGDLVFLEDYQRIRRIAAGAEWIETVRELDGLFDLPPDPDCDPDPDDGDDGCGPAFFDVTDLGVTGDGTVYVGISVAGGGDGGSPLQVFAVRSEGPAEHVFGDGSACFDFSAGGCGDGGSAVEASVTSGASFVVTPDGTLYINDAGRIRRVEGDRVIHAFGCFSDFCVDDPVGDGHAGARNLTANALTVAPDGSLYFIDSSSRAIRKIATDGMMTTIVSGQCSGLPSEEACGDGGPAAEAGVGFAFADMAVDGDGRIYVVDFYYGGDGNGFVLRRFTPGGRAELVAGVVRNCFSGECAQIGPGLSVGLDFRDVRVLPDGSLVVPDEAGLFLLGSAGSVFEPDEFIVPSPGAGVLDVFGPDGRHRRTIDAVTGVQLFTFEYGPAGLLAAVVDEQGNRTEVERNAEGDATAIVGPYGHRTELAVGADGWLASIEDPAGAVTSMTYTTDGLLTGFTTPGGGTASFTYDDSGRLLSDTNAEGETSTLERVELPDGYQVTFTSPEGRATRYVATVDDSGVSTATVELPSGATIAESTSPEGAKILVTADGSTVVDSTEPDPRWGWLAPRTVETVRTLPGGTTSTTERSLDVQLSDPSDLMSVAAIVETTTVDGRTTTQTWDAATRTMTRVSAAGRTTTTTLDELGRPVAAAGEGPDRAWVWSDDGRLESVTIGGRTAVNEWDALGRVVAVEAPGGERTTYTYDAVDRVLTITRPEGGTYSFGYDADGNRTSVTLPSGEQHLLPHDAVGRRTGWSGGGITETVGRDLDGLTTSRTLGDGSAISTVYDSGGRPTTESFPEGQVQWNYLDGTGRPASLVRVGGGIEETLTWTHEGPYTASTTASASVDGSPIAGRPDVSADVALGDSFAVSSIEVTSGADLFQIPVTRDADLIATSFGDFSFTPDGPGGLPTSVSDGAATLVFGFGADAALSNRSLVIGGDVVADMSVTRDANGRVAEVERTLDGITSTTTYGYDGDGRIVSVEDADGIRSFSYDVDSNPTVGPGGAAVFGPGGRLESVDGVAYTYDARGNLVGRGSDTFEYSAAGELLSATVDGETVTYTYDGLGRRTSRTTDDGTTTYFYANPDSPFRVSASRAADGSFRYLNHDSAGTLVAVDGPDGRRYVATDQVGTPYALFDDVGTLVERIDLGPWGEYLGDDDWSTLADVVGFAGGIPDPLTGLVRFGARDYDPTSGRWTARDPSLFAGGANLYGYVANDPVNLIDPTGRWCVSGGYYSGLGGSVEYCQEWDPNEGDYKRSVCVTGGVGAGVSAGISGGGAQEGGLTAGAGVGLKCGGQGADLKVVYEFGCPEDGGDFSVDLDIDLGVIKVTVNQDGVSPSISLDNILNGIESKCGVGASAGVTACVDW